MAGSDFDMLITLIVVHSSRGGPIRIETNDTSFVPGATSGRSKSPWRYYGVGPGRAGTKRGWRVNLLHSAFQSRKLAVEILRHDSVRPRRSRISSAVFFQTIGFGSAFQYSTKFLMSLPVPQRFYGRHVAGVWSVRNPNQRCTWLSQEERVGVKCSWKQDVWPANR